MTIHTAFILSVAVAPLTLSASEGGGYEMRAASVVGGAWVSTGGDYALGSSAGQPLSGEQTGKDYGLTIGIGPVIAQAGPDPVSPEPSPVSKVRFISFVVPSNASGMDTALRVQLTDLYGTKVCCNAEGTSCNTTSCAENGNCSGAFSTCTQRLLAFEDTFRYVNTFDGSTTCLDSATFNTSYRCGLLGCQPQYRDWGSDVGSVVLFVTGDSVAPGGTYAVSHIAHACGAAPGADICTQASSVLAVATATWGDAGGSGGGPSDGVTNVIDIGLVVDNVKGLATAIPEYRAWMKHQSPMPNIDLVNVVDIGFTVDAVKGFAYPFGATACP